MKIKYFILIILIISFIQSQEEIVMRDYISNGRLDALIDNNSEQIYLVQLDVMYKVAPPSGCNFRR